MTAVGAMNGKKCSSCGQEKSFEEFGKDARHSDGRQSWCLSCSATWRRAARKRNPEQARAILKRWYQKHTDRERAKSRVRSAKRWTASRERIKAAQRARYAKDPGRRKAIVSACIDRHPERVKQQRLQAWNKRRARKLAAISEPIDYERIKRRDRMMCHICRKKVSEKQLQFDHVIPLARGGEHTERNLAVAHARCNQQKNVSILTLF